MPRGDGSGPNGMGPMTGRGAGYCAGFAAPGFANGAPGFGFGGGGAFGRGRGRRNMYYATGVPGWARAQQPYVAPAPVAPVAAAPAAGLDALKAQAAQMQAALENIQSRIDAMQAPASDDSDQ